MAKIALLIGVSEYEPGLNSLPAAVKDAAALQRILQEPEMGGFDEVKVLTNPDPQTMQYEVESLFTDCRKDDLVLLFFSGHGIKDDSNNLYFATRITRKNPKGNLIRSTAVPARFIHEVMNNSRAKRQAIILDCCFSGAFDPALQVKDDGSVDLQGQLGAEGRVVLTSSSSTQYSFEQQGSELSLYTRYLVEGIETGAGDRNEDGKISMRELHDYAASKVRETAPNMTPKLITLKDMGFEIVLAKAKVTDPKLRYRRQVERYASRGTISPVGRTILDKFQALLSLSSEVSREIESEVLRPYQERLENLQRYQQAFAEAVEHEYPLRSYVKSELEDLRKILGLRYEDTVPIQAEVTSEIIGKVDTYQNNEEISSMPPPVEPQYRIDSPNSTHSSHHNASISTRWIQLENKIEWNFWFRWVGASLSAFTLAPVPFLFDLSIYTGLPISMTLIGTVQWLVLRRKISGVNWWILATVVGGVIGVFIGGATGWSVTDGMLRNWVKGGFFGGAIGGTVVGIAQWLVIRRKIPKTHWWILACAVSAAIAGAISSDVSNSYWSDRSTLATIIMAATFSVIYNIGTGSVMLWLLNQLDRRDM
jgi:hypothetical protein